MTTPRELPEGGTTFGTRAVGPMGLLEELELRTGCFGAGLDRARTAANGQRQQRFLRYAKALTGAAENHRELFCSESMQDAPFTVAAHLLRIRDELAAAGFDFTVKSDMPSRLRDLCRVEAQLSPDSPVRAGYGDRASAVIAKLEHGVRPVSLVGVSLFDAYELLPKPVGRLLDALKKCGIKIATERNGVHADSSTMLGRVQRALVESNDAGPGGAGADDDSLVIARTGSTIEALQLVARSLRENDIRRKTALIVPQGRNLLDEFLRADGSPASGSRGLQSHLMSSLRYVAALLWNPPDAKAFAGLLASPVSPLPPGMSRRLLHAFEEYPGVGNPEWNEAYEKALKAIPDQDRRERVRKRYAAFVERKRYPRTGAPVEAVAELFGGVARILRGRGAVGAPRAAGLMGATSTGGSKGEVDVAGASAALGTADAAAATGGPGAAGATGTVEVAGAPGAPNTPHENRHTKHLYASLAAACDWVAEAAAAFFGTGEVPEHRLEQLIDYCIDYFAVEGGIPEQAGRALVVDSPDAIGSPVDDLIWAPAVAEPAIEEAFFTSEEREWLLQRGTPVEDAAAPAERRFVSAVLAFSLARSRVLFVVPDDTGEDGSTVEPLVSVVEALSGTGGRVRPHLNETAYMQTKIGIRDDILRTTLPQRAAQWHIKPGIAAPRKTESYSSLTDLLFYPYRYVLRYHAKLERSALGGIPEGGLLYGNLLHTCANLLLREEGIADDAGAKDWLRHRFDQILYSYGWPLLETGCERLREYVRNHIENSLTQLTAMLRAAGAIQVETEHTQESELGSIQISGRIDVFGTGGASPVLIDLKWGGWSSRRKEIEEAVDMQLAIYALLAGVVSENVSAAYLIANRDGAIAHPGSSFANADIPEGALPASKVFPGLLVAVEENAKYRYRQLEEGTVMLSPDETGETLPDPGITLPDQAHRYDEFANLLGWGEA